VRVTGPAATAFPNGPPAEPKPDQGKTASAAPAPKDPLPPQIKSAVQPINVIVVADTDILDDTFWVQVQDFFGQRVELPVANNGDFVDNAVDTLAGGNDLINLRSRGTAARPFQLIDNIQQAADEKYQATAKGLEDKLKDTEQKIKDISDQEKNPGVTQTAGEERALESFRTDMIRTRQQLRQVQLAEREDISTLEGWIEFFDIAAIPILVGLAACVVGFVRLERRKRRARMA